MLIVGRYSRPIFDKILCVDVPRVIFILSITTSAIPLPPSVLLRTEHIQLLFIIAYLHFE
jgi:hypothetical protein